ncbi:MAG: HepT-like ribonuclease domain-containing protein [bacterium]|nr:HepT-like ribonuclease domain-containing protein [bacterium]
MNPIKYDLLEKKQAILLKEIALIKKIEKEYFNQRAEELVQHALLHAMQNAIAATIDISQHICAELSKDAVESYAESIERSGDLGVLPKELVAHFSRIAKLRNIMVHLYDNINFEYIIDSKVRRRF